MAAGSGLDYDRASAGATRVGGDRATTTDAGRGTRTRQCGPGGLARFYERLLGWPITDREGPRPGYPPEDGWAKVRSPAGDQKIEFQYEQHYTPPVWPPAEGRQQMMIHLDIGVEELDAGIAWALEAGATLAEHQPVEGQHVLLDPAGHPFCLFPDQL